MAQKYEYKVVHLILEGKYTKLQYKATQKIGEFLYIAELDVIQDVLNNYAAQGWKVVSVHWFDVSLSRVTFEREISQ